MTAAVINALRRTVAHRPGRPATAEPRGIGAQHVTGHGVLLLVRVGLFALFRGISEIVIAFELRRAQRP